MNGYQVIRKNSSLEKKVECKTKYWQYSHSKLTNVIVTPITPIPTPSPPMEYQLNWNAVQHKLSPQVSCMPTPLTTQKTLATIKPTFNFSEISSCVIQHTPQLRSYNVPSQPSSKNYLPLTPETLDISLISNTLMKYNIISNTAQS